MRDLLKMMCYMVAWMCGIFGILYGMVAPEYSWPAILPILLCIVFLILGICLKHGFTLQTLKDIF